MKKITTSQLKKQIEDKELVLINVLPEEQFALATLPNSVNFCVYKTSFIDEVTKAVKNKNTKIIVFGESKKYEAAARAADVLQSGGYKDVIVYEDGVEGWKKSKGKIVGSKKVSKSASLKKKYTVNKKDSYVEWEGSNIANKHFGTIAIIKGFIATDAKKITGGKFVIDMNAITVADITNKKMAGYLIEHLKSSDFFEVDTYPTATIEILKATKISDIPSSLNFKIDASVTIKDVTKKVTFTIHGHLQDKKLIAQGSLVLDRSAFGVKYGSSKFFEKLGMHLVHDQIRLRFKIVGE